MTSVGSGPEMGLDRFRSVRFLFAFVGEDFLSAERFDAAFLGASSFLAFARTTGFDFCVVR